VLVRAVATDAIKTKVVGQDEEDVGFHGGIGRQGLSAKHARQRNEKHEVFHGICPPSLESGLDREFTSPALSVAISLASPVRTSNSGESLGRT
jgi:hypothetical protein